jgi:crotonobetainyl-CoA:carnitine CoA-transferase CaiB-like acyl-CoA transferase
MSGPLSGFRIIDLTSMLSGPWATSILGDQGADVIKVEVPGVGDHTRSLGNRSGDMPAHFLNINRAKRSITLNLKQARGKEILTELVKTADVLIQNFRPGVVERLGIAESDFRSLAPGLIYVSISGFGEKGPLAGEPVYDPIIQAMSGLTTVQAGSDEERPRLIRTILPDKLTSVVTAQAITAALLARTKSGQGQHVRLSMLDSVINFLWASDMGAYTFPDKEMPAQKAASFIDLIYETADGFMTASTMGNKEWSALSRAFDMPELLEDERFKTPALRDQNVNERLKLIQDVLRKQPTAYWLDAFAREGVPAAPALKRAEVIQHPQVEASEILVELDHPVAGRLRQTRPAARFEQTPATPGRGAPRLGEHTDELLTELGYTDEDIGKLRSDGVIGQETYGTTES